MFDIKELLNLLNEGKDAGDIADAFTDSLNAAIKQHEAESNAAEIKTKKIKIINNIVGLFCDLCKEYYPEIYDEEYFKSLLDPERILELVDESYKEANEIYSLLMSEKDNKTKTEPEEEVDPLIDFLSKHSLLN